MSAMSIGRVADHASLATRAFRLGAYSPGEVALQPLECARPGVVGGSRVVLGPLVAVEPVACSFVADDLVSDGGAAELGAQALDVVDRNRSVEVSEQTEPGRAHRRRLVDERRELR